jgi:hypothetical protein
MDYTQFVEFLKKQDARNVIIETKSCINNMVLPDELKLFYQNYNPVDVEINFNGLGLRFYSIEDLYELQQEYSYIKDIFVFASCNSDPVFLKDGKIFTCPHGVSKPNFEELACSFDAYLLRLMHDN